MSMGLSLEAVHIFFFNMYMFGSETKILTRDGVAAVVWAVSCESMRICSSCRMRDCSCFEHTME